MIVLDIESSGISTGDCGIWQIGAIELENPKNYFLEEARIDSGDVVTESALMVTGKTEKDLRNPKKQSQKKLIINYLNWASKIKEKMYIGQNIGWDINFIQNKCIKYGIMDLFRKVQSQRSMDLHTLAQEKYNNIKGNYCIDEKGKSKMNLLSILEFCGIPDKRIHVEGDKKIKKGKSHEALEDCKLEGECYFRLEYGKNLFSEFKKFKIPEYLKK
jgi:DNA polymerase III epsilon subunit-like protein